MKRALIIISIIAATSSACDKTVNLGSENDNPRKDITLTKTQSEFVTTGNTFAFNFIDKVNTAEAKDYMISPLSLQFLLGMILEGAEGQTAEEISTVLGYGSGGAQEVNEYCLAMLTQLPEVDKATKLAIANAIILNQECTLRKSYQDNVTKYYQAEAVNKNFYDTKGTADYINNWCSRHTEGLIPKVLDEVSPDIMAYLINALYFKSKWSRPFRKDMSDKRQFTDETGKKADVTMMIQESEFRHYSGKEFNAVQMDYGNGAYTMTVMLPNSGYKVADVCAFLKTVSWQEFFKRFYTCKVNLWIPRFETDYKIKLNDLLSDMGMPKSFKPGAEFLKMSEHANYLDFVKQFTKIIVDEEGTEAAAISIGGMARNTSVGQPDPIVYFHADHPFLYVISERSTGAVLFAGRFSNN
ncbi:MAG: serpin family protein [Bacteroidales bacterium]|nr:serpin family protein [Bacteroidales bacterium]